MLRSPYPSLLHTWYNTQIRSLGVFLSSSASWLTSRSGQLLRRVPSTVLPPDRHTQMARTEDEEPSSGALTTQTLACLQTAKCLGYTARCRNLACDDGCPEMSVRDVHCIMYQLACRIQGWERRFLSTLCPLVSRNILIIIYPNL